MVPLLRWSVLAPIAVLVLLVPFASSRAGDGRVVESAQDVFDCVSQNAPDTTMKQQFQLKVHDRGGGMQTLQADLHWKRDPTGDSKILVELSAPADLRGSSYLLIERDGGNDVFAYLPELKLVRRITGRHSAGSVFGSDFSYEDLERLYHVAQSGNSKRLSDQTIDGRTAWVVETRPSENQLSAYHKTVGWVDQQTCVVLKTVFYQSEGEVRKTLVADASSLERVDGVWLPRRVRIDDRRSATHTELEVDKIEFDVEIPDRVFSRSSLERRGR